MKSNPVNPFRSLVSHIKEYQQEADKTKKKASLKEIFGDTSEVLGMVNECFDSVIGGLKNMGLAGDEETQKLLGSISNMVGSAGKLADGIASMNPATMISGAVGLISSAFDVFDRRSRKANRAIKQHQENVKNLEKQYRQLERETAKAIGSEKYSKQIEQVNNLYQKIAETEGMIAAEQSKRSKKRDDGKIADWESQIEDYRDKIEELRQGIIDELSTTDLYSFSNDMASSIVDGLCNGLDNGKEAIQEKINDLMKSIISKQLDVFVIQKSMSDMFQKMADAFNENSAGGFELTNWEIDQIVSAGQQGKEQILGQLGRYQELLKKLGLVNSEVEDEIENGVTGELQAAVTEGTASQLVGLWNMSALDIRSLLNLSHEHFIECRKQLANIANIYVQIVEINNNTKATADNTETLVEELKTGIKSLETKLDEIRKTLKTIMVEDSMELKERIALLAGAAGACSEGLQELAATKSRVDMLRCFFDNIKFCLSRHTPSSVFLRSNFGDMMHGQGLYADETVNVKNQKEIAFVGKCYAVVEITERMMCRIWAADSTKLNIRASNGARLIIDALDTADIIVDECSGAHITVYLYGNATCTGADLIVRKGNTYEL